jgi:20S proteasome subunit alpha 3
MSRRYDQSTTTFSPEGKFNCCYFFLICKSDKIKILGRLHQVEYAIEAINNAGTCVGLKSADGIVLAAEKRTVSKLLAPSKTSEKTYTIDDHIICLMAGLTADANILVEEARTHAQK